MNQSKKPSRIGLFKRIPILWAAGFLLSIQVSAIEQTLPYQNPERSAEQRVDDLRARMTLREKAGQLSQYVGIEHIKEAVYCISVPSEVFYIRRNGKAVWTGNSRHGRQLRSVRTSKNTHNRERCGSQESK